MVDQTPPETPIRLYRYDTPDFGFVYPMDLTGFNAVMKVKVDRNPITQVLFPALTPGDGLTVITGPESEITLQLTTQQWDALASLPGAYYDLEISQGAWRKTYFRGPLTVEYDL